MAEAPDLAGEYGPGLRRKKGIIVGLSTEPPRGRTVICRDELGPIAARRSPGPRWRDETPRPHVRPDDARHGSRGAFGALAHRTGAALVQTTATRDTAAWLRLLDRLEAFAPLGDASLIVDALPLHWSVDTMLWNGTGALRASTSCPCPNALPGSTSSRASGRSSASRRSPGVTARGPTRSSRPCTPGSASGIGTRRPSSGDARPSRGGNSNARIFIVFEERRT